MKFSVSFFSNINDSVAQNMQNHYEFLFKVIQFAEEHDWYGVWFPERHYHTFGGLFPSPSVFAAAVARETKKLRIQVGSVILPLHSPIRIAEEWAMVDQLSKGRVSVSFASGWNPNDFIENPENFDNRKELMWEGMKRIENLWNDREKDITIFPKTYQKRIPIYVTVASSKKTCYEAGKRGYHLLTHFIFNDMNDVKQKIELYYAGLRDGGHSIKDKDVTILLHTYLDYDLKTVEQVVKNAFYEYQYAFLSLAEATPHYVSKREEEIAKTLMLRKYSPHYSLLGTPETCKTVLKKLEEIGVTQVAALIDFGLEKQKIMESLERLHLLVKGANVQTI
ncbi:MULTISPECIES: MupA/Atu3671 family FMN-dependent luciferase-like monooxygenase [Aneurinibacillus]|uniref:LLM class flavin-dependent oxidoreductase n=2 Tax=Aneurinibacillus thermoaerophilus TaxID=143495 RepID=A0A1G7YDR7_ANETH|nr:MULTISPECIES: MupA/Atu3671 family FMN-dependent luciferase-like monooxygenase [Aneurinibacillus]AMA72207.1 alkane 1-monooxygenase [Aneurinibacillus sp. XH2]MED0676494.1 LLM class flavin-dependent oxidoreductase [Aneurinibacillus thermoaerophilus]MED0679006.1 LLM class flavin-dependent oxidoreductase [Aneurinibacillus thermoaerophilus]MED0736543.1 LLM class flavin-dependent oxidoreductase [Aneurinibacillus thermoaerophilus]MED0756047.1 LLM class flavin-dependent oxidoreductase [Aneurinibacil